MAPPPTPRQQARAENIVRIKQLALAQLAESGAGALSLRAIARELDIVSSAIYRYYARRDDLVTALVIDAYNDLATALESASRPSRSPWRQWVDTCQALRAWAVHEPHRFSLLYGTPLPGYEAPPETIEPAGRVAVALLATAVSADPLDTRAIPRALAPQLDTSFTALELPVRDRAAGLALVGALGQVIGLVSLEINGQFVGGFEPADTLFTALVERTADALRLPTTR